MVNSVSMENCVGEQVLRVECDVYGSGRYLRDEYFW